MSRYSHDNDDMLVCAGQDIVDMFVNGINGAVPGLDMKYKETKCKYTCRDLCYNMMDTHCHSNSEQVKQLRMREARLEKYIKDYVYDKTAESVYLHLDDAIMISHVTKKGSITLAILWANILQHPDNYHPDKYKYSKFYDTPTGGDRLIVKADGVNFTVFMASGSLVMEGRYIYDWFSKKFHQLLDNYDQSFQNTWTFIPTPSMPGANVDEDREKYIPETDTEKYLMYMTTHHATGTAIDRKMEELPGDLIPGLGNLNIDQTLFEGDDLTTEIDSLKTGGVKDGFTYIYKLWKSLLNKWFSDKDTAVYVITPELDSARLHDIVDLNILHQYKGGVDTIYTNADCDKYNGRNVEQVKMATLREYEDKYRTYVDYKILNKMMIPTKKVNARVIAGVKGDEAEVMMTSAGFHGNSFLHESMETVTVQTTSKEDFISNFIVPIASPVVASTF